MAPNPIFTHFWAIFPIFRLIFSYFLGEAETYIFPIFFLFRAGGPKWGLYQANRIPSLVVIYSNWVPYHWVYRLLIIHEFSVRRLVWNSKQFLGASNWQVFLVT